MDTFVVYNNEFISYFLKNSFTFNYEMTWQKLRGKELQGDPTELKLILNLFLRLWGNLLNETYVIFPRKVKLFIFQKVRNELIIINNKSVKLFYLIIMMNLLFHLVFVMNLLFHLFSKIVFHKPEYIRKPTVDTQALTRNPMKNQQINTLLMLIKSE